MTSIGNAFRDLERNAHYRLADRYHAFFVSVTEHAAEPLLTQPRVSARMTLLEVGCGSGVVATRAGRRGSRLGARVRGGRILRFFGVTWWCRSRRRCADRRRGVPGGTLRSQPLCAD